MIIGNFEARKYRFNRWLHLIVASSVAVHLTSVERHVLFKVSYFVVQLRHSWGRKSVKRRYKNKQPNENYRDPQNNPERPSRVDLNNGYISDSVKSNPVRFYMKEFDEQNTTSSFSRIESDCVTICQPLKFSVQSCMVVNLSDVSLWPTSRDD